MMMIQPMMPIPRNASLPFSPGCASRIANKAAPFRFASCGHSETVPDALQGAWGTRRCSQNVDAFGACSPLGLGPGAGDRSPAVRLLFGRPQGAPAGGSRSGRVGTAGAMGGEGSTTMSRSAVLTSGARTTSGVASPLP